MVCRRRGPEATSRTSRSWISPPRRCPYSPPPPARAPPTPTAAAAPAMPASDPPRQRRRTSFSEATFVSRGESGSRRRRLLPRAWHRLLRGTFGLRGVAVMARRAMASGDPKEVRRLGNEQYKRGSFGEALGLYNAVCRSNMAAALIALGRLPEAVVECELAIGLDPSFGRAHQWLASLLHRLGQVENARKHLLTMQFPDPIDFAKIRGVEKHFTRCIEARRTGD